MLQKFKHFVDGVFPELTNITSALKRLTFDNVAKHILALPFICFIKEL